MKATWIIKTSRAVQHVAGQVSHVNVTLMEAGRFWEMIEDRRKGPSMPRELGVRSYDTCACMGTCEC